jgi:hypothetical protein
MTHPPPPPSCYRSAPKPQRLSDPSSDFEPAELQAILAKDFRVMVWHDFQNLFGPALPAGTYDELRYYVSHFVQFLWDHPKDRLDLVNPWGGFAGEHWDEIIEDKADDYVHAVHRSLLAEMTREFKLSPENYVYGTEEINTFLCQLWDYQSQRGIAWEFLQQIADFGDDLVKCGWFLELSKSRFQAYGHPPRDPEVADLLQNPERYGKALDLLMKHGIEGAYWDETLQILGI